MAILAISDPESDLRILIGSEVRGYLNERWKKCPSLVLGVNVHLPSADSARAGPNGLPQFSQRSVATVR